VTGRNDLSAALTRWRARPSPRQHEDRSDRDQHGAERDGRESQPGPVGDRGLETGMAEHEHILLERNACPRLQARAVLHLLREQERRLELRRLVHLLDDVRHVAVAHEQEQACEQAHESERNPEGAERGDVVRGLRGHRKGRFAGHVMPAMDAIIILLYQSVHNSVILLPMRTAILLCSR